MKDKYNRLIELLADKKKTAVCRICSEVVCDKGCPSLRYFFSPIHIGDILSHLKSGKLHKHIAWKGLSDELVDLWACFGFKKSLQEMEFVNRFNSKTGLREEQPKTQAERDLILFLYSIFL